MIRGVPLAVLVLVLTGCPAPAEPPAVPPTPAVTAVAPPPTTHREIALVGPPQHLLPWPDAAPTLANYIREKGEARRDPKHALVQPYGDEIAQHLKSAPPLPPPLQATPGAAYVIEDGTVYRIQDRCPPAKPECHSGTFYALEPWPIPVIDWPEFAEALPTAEAPTPIDPDLYTQYRPFYDRLRTQSATIADGQLLFVTLREVMR